MKKTVRTYTKRSLSVLMAALLLLTCWTFVVPQMAGAVNTGTYYFKVDAEVTDDMDNCYMNFYCYGKATNGTGSESQIGSGYWSDKNTDNTTYTVIEGSSTSFPERVEVTDRNGEEYYVGRSTTIKFHLYVGSSTSNYQELSLSGTFISSSGCDTFDVSGNQITWETGYNVTAGKSNYFDARFTVGSGNYPKVVSEDDIIISLQPSDIQIDKTNPSNNFAKDTSFRTYARDQYGVTLSSSVAPVTYTISIDDDNVEAGSNKDYTFTTNPTTASYDSCTFTVNRRLPNSDGFHVIITATYGSYSKDSSEFTVTDPSYTQTIVTNAGDLYSSETDHSEEKHILDGYYNLPYYQNQGNASTATYYNSTNNAVQTPGFSFPHYGVLLGYTFKGFYNNNNGLGTTGKKDGYSGNWILRGDGTFESAWNPTGTKLDSESLVVQDNTWYGMWQANPVRVTINDRRGVPQNTYYGTYGQTVGTIAGSNTIAASMAGYSESTYNYVFKGWGIVDCKAYNEAGGQVEQYDQLVFDPSDAIPATTLRSRPVTGDIVLEPLFDISPAGYVKYTVTFHNTNNSTTVHNDYRYADVVSSKTVPTQTGMKASLKDYNANKYTYDFAGWSSTKPTTAATNYVSDGNHYLFDTQDEAEAIIENLSETTVLRNNMEFYPVWYRTYIDYTIDFLYVPDGKSAGDAAATNDFASHPVYGCHWGDTITAPYLYTKDENDNDVPFSYTYDGTRYQYIGWDSQPTTCAGNATFTAQYGDPIVAKYNVKFVDTTVYGTPEAPVLIKEFTNIGHHSSLNIGSFSLDSLAGLSVEIDGETVALQNTVDDEDGYRYTFNGYRPDLVTEDITSDAIYTAKWARQIITTVKFYNNGTYLEGKDITGVGGTVINYPGEEPAKAPDKIADHYAFDGWEDAAGNVVTRIPENTPELKLYARYAITYHDYLITFKNDDGSVLSSETYHYGAMINAPEPTKPSTPLYNYTFSRWDKTVVPVEDDATYTAIYVSHYNYYSIQWLNDDGSLFMPSSYIYNERISIPYATPENKLTYPDPGEGYTIGFLGWRQYVNDVAGEYYTRSDRCTGTGIVYKAEFGPVARQQTVTFYDETGATVISTISVAYNSTLNDNEAKIPTAKKNPNETNHFEFDKWVNPANAAFDDNTAIKADISLNATFTSEAHTFRPKTIDLAPTFTTEGSATEECEVCGTNRDVTVPALSDTIAPTVKLMVRDLSWNSSALDTAVNQVGPGNLLAIATKDTAEVDANYNPSGDGSMVQTIDVVIAEEDSVRDIDQIADGEWYNSYTRAASDTGNANTADILKIAVEQINAAQPYDIEHGDKFVIYVRATDAKNNTTYVRSSVLQYDTNAPDLNIGAEDEFFNENRTIFCGAATIEVDTDAPVYTLTINDVVVTPSNDKYTLRDPGYYAVTARDIAGNAATKNIEIKADHSYNAISIAPTCTAAGSTYNICSVCGNRTEAVPTDPLGHDTVTVTVEPTCTTAGYTYDYCRRCNSKVGEDRDPVPMFNHTYPDNAETYGELAGQSAWKENEYLHKNPTCSATGKAYFVCQLCGEQREDTLDIVPEAHSFYRGVTTDPNCTTDGFITYTCKYCGFVKTITPEDGDDYAYLAATGHTPGEWSVTPATCAEAGSRVKLCAVCGVEIEDTRETIPALEPQWVAVVTPPGDGTQGYTTYTCAGCGGTVAGHETYQGDYVDPLSRVTIKFVNEDGTDVVEPIEKLTGESIAESAVPIPTKASDDTYNYTFACWLDSEEQPVTFPITAGEEDATYTASYTERYINYTLILNRPNDEVFKKLGYQHNDGSTIDLAVGPKKDSNDTTDFTFDGWFYKYNVDGNVLESTPAFTSATLSDLIAAGIFNDAHEATLYPHYAESAREYTVVFGYDPENILATVVVNFGAAAVYPADAVEPTKAYDELGHYAWSGWSADLTSVVQNLFVKPVFTKSAHDYAVETTEREGEAQCTEPVQAIYTCDCGYSYTATISAAPGHTWGAGVDGTQTCEVCGATRPDQTLYTVAFVADGVKVKSYNAKYGETFTAPANPTKEADAQHTYSFAYWYTTDDATAVEVNTTCTGNITYYAKFDQTDRLFSVAFGYDANDIIKTYTNIPYGGSVTYDGPAPVKASDSNYHYTFTGWNKDTSVVTDNMNVYATFSKEGHSFDNGVEQSAATCQHGKIMKYTCPACGYSYTKEIGSALQHNWVEDVTRRVNPTPSADGTKVLRCTHCGNEKTETIPRIFLKVTVKDQNGNAVSGVTVKVYDGSTFIGSDVSNGSGVATIFVPEAKTYRIEIEGKSANVTVDGNGNVTGGSVPTVERNSGGSSTSHGCDCTCHKSGLWPTIFRFFHKIIKMITGEFRCCPDANY